MIARVRDRRCTSRFPRLAPSNPNSSQYLDTELLHPFRLSRLAPSPPFVLFPRSERFRLPSRTARTEDCSISFLRLIRGIRQGLSPALGSSRSPPPCHRG